MWRSFFDLVVRGLTLLSLLLCAAVSAAWVAAQWRGGYIEYMGVDLGAMRDRQAMVWLGRRSIALHGAATQWSGERGVLEHYLRTGRPGVNWVPLPPLEFGDPANRTTWAAAGFGYRRTTDAGPRIHREGVTVEVPYWCLILLTLSAPAAVAVRAFRRRRRRSRGLCPRCGYDLRASPDRCPECGWVPVSDPPIPDSWSRCEQLPGEPRTAVRAPSRLANVTARTK